MKPSYQKHRLKEKIPSLPLCDRRASRAPEVVGRKHACICPGAHSIRRTALQALEYGADRPSTALVPLLARTRTIIQQEQYHYTFF